MENVSAERVPITEVPKGKHDMLGASCRQLLSSWLVPSRSSEPVSRPSKPISANWPCWRSRTGRRRSWCQANSSGPVATLQRPSWGAWNGLLQGLARARPVRIGGHASGGRSPSSRTGTCSGRRRVEGLEQPLERRPPSLGRRLRLWYRRNQVVARLVYHPCCDAAPIAIGTSLAAVWFDRLRAGRRSPPRLLRRG